MIHPTPILLASPPSLTNFVCGLKRGKSSVVKILIYSSPNHPNRPQKVSSTVFVYSLFYFFCLAFETDMLLLWFLMLIQMLLLTMRRLVIHIGLNILREVNLTPPCMHRSSKMTILNNIFTFDFADKTIVRSTPAGTSTEPRIHVFDHQKRRRLE